MFTRSPSQACPRAFGLWGIVLAQLFCVSIQAAGQNYFIKSWQNEDGLPQDSVNCVVQTHDGYLWLGTYNGLVRFDGIHLTVFYSDSTPELKNSRITSLFEDSRTRLWIGHETGDITCYERGKFHSVATAYNRSGGAILSLGEDSDDRIYSLNVNGMLVRLDDGASFPPSTGVGVAGSTISFAKDREGRLWVLRSGELSLLTNGVPVPVRLGAPGANFAKAVCAGRDGGLWILLEQFVRKWTNGQWSGDSRHCPPPQRTVTSMSELSSGVIAVGTEGEGLYLLAPGTNSIQINHTNNLSDDWVRSLCEDSEGNLWAGTGNGGLDVLRPGKVSEITPPDHWGERAVLSVCTAGDGGQWIGTEGAGLYHFGDGKWEHFGAADGLANPFVWSVLEDAQGHLWVGTWGGGLYVRSDKGFETAPGFRNFGAPVTALYQDRDGNLWAGTGVGLARFTTNEVKWFRRDDGSPLADIRAVAEDGEKSIWFGMSGGGLGQIKSGKLNVFTKKDNLASDFIECLHVDQDDLWIGTFGAGLCRYKAGQFVTLGTRQGIPNNVIVAIEDDGHGNFWMSSHGGLFRVNKEALNRCGDGKTPAVNCLVYGKGKGLPTLECSGGFQPVVGRTQNGQLWFPTRKGLIAVTPDSVVTNSLPPPVVLEDLLVDGHSIDLPANGLPFKIPPGRGQLEFRYTALCFTAPEKVRFKRKLDGSDPDWVESDANTRSVTYNVLPGNYTFHITACNDDGVWNETGATLELSLSPHFWQTWTFRILGGVFTSISAGAAVLFVMRRRMRQKLERLERQQAVERERARIARDIHDDLGASLTRIMLLSQSPHGEAESPEHAGASQEQIYETARDLTRAMDEIVWAVNPKHDTLDSLVTYLGKFAQDFLRPVGIRCRIEVPLQLPPVPLTAELRHNLFLAFKETLNNVAKHAGASEVRISLVLNSKDFALVIEDNGRGFAVSDHRTGNGAARANGGAGDGLLNMRGRLEKIHGRCEIQSAPGGGTKVTFSVKASK